MKTKTDTLLSRLQGALVLLALAATPLFFTTAAYEQFIRPKIAWAETFAILLVLLAGLRAFTGRRVRLPIHGVNIILALYLLWNLLMWPLATSRSVAAETVSWLAIVIIISLSWQEWAGGRRRRVLITLWYFAAAACITALWTIYQDILMKWGASLPAWIPRLPMVTNKLGDWRGFLTAGFGNTDHIAEFLVVVYLPAILLMLHTRGRLRTAALLIILWIMSTALILCWSVGNNASLILGSLILLIGIGRSRRRFIWRHRRPRLFIWATGCALIVLCLVTNNPLNPHRPGIFQEAFSSSRWHEGGSTRGVIWLNAFEMIRRNQIKGVGPGCFTYVYPSMASEFVPNDPEWLKYQGAYTNAAHNAILQAWAELGPIGALLLISLVIAAFRALAGAASSGPALTGWMAWGGIAALAVQCGTAMMTFPLQLPASTIIFFALLPLGNILSSATRGGAFRMPALVMQGDSGELVVYTRDMDRIDAIAGSFSVRKSGVTLLLILWTAMCALWMFATWKPLASDIIYNRASQARRGGNFDTADKFYQRALALYPNHHDCRSEYSDFLLQRGRYQDCIDQLDLVFRRLDSKELYLRRAQAYQALGQKAQAQHDIDTFQKRNLWGTTTQPTPTN